MTQLSLALNRFGLGARPDEPAPSDPKAWLLGQLKSYDPRPPAIAAAPSRADVAADLANYIEETRGQGQARRQQPQPAMAQSSMAPAGGAMAEMDKDERIAGLPDSAKQYIRHQAQDYYLRMVGARTAAALTTPTPFVERLVHFWSNHFAVSADKFQTIGMAGLLEFEAIRPHVLGRFEDMLVAVEQHPAMLLYLDQAQSVGPDSMIAERAAARGGPKRGLNENLGREILELHTLGVDSGYTQADVTEFARALTGWTVSGLLRGPAARFAGVDGAPGQFVFAESIHEPGERHILGRGYGQQGEAQGRAILHDLALNPKTAQHLSTKLARHFAGDNPPPALVARLAEAYSRSGGDLPTVYRTLIDSPEVWLDDQPKFKTPWDWSISAMRAVGTKTVPDQAAAGLYKQLGQPVWRPGSPAGYDDIAASWAGPDALVRRVEAAERIAAKAGGVIDARALAPKLLAEQLTPMTSEAVARAESPPQALALLLVAPEFLRR